MRFFPISLILFSLVVVAGSESSLEPVFLTAREGVNLPQWVHGPQGETLLIWRESAAAGSNIFLAFHTEKGWGEPLRVNQVSDSVTPYAHDEIRASVAISGKGRVAVAWTDKQGDIRVAFGAPEGFAPSLRLNQDQGSGSQSFPVIAFDSEGVLYGVWLDARRAEPGMEEPADLYMARVSGTEVREQNLTQGQKASVCGCCRPYMEIDDQNNFRINFRKVNEEGYRDIYEIGGQTGSPGAPTRTSPPIWKLAGCPMAGPVVAGGATLWLDGSTGRRRLLEAVNDQTMPRVILESGDEKRLLFPPRLVQGSEGRLILQPVSPRGLLLERDGSGWKERPADLPSWATSGLLVNGVLHLIGMEEGRFRYASRTL